MKINIQAPWEVNDYLKQVILEKIEKLTTFNDRILSADIFMKLGDAMGQDDKLIEVRLSVPGPDLFAQANADSFEKAVAEVAEKLRKQIIKQKEKRNQH